MALLSVPDTSLRAQEEGPGDLLIGHAIGRMQGYPGFLGRERLSRLGSAGARLGSSGGEFVGGIKHPGGEVHLLEGLISGAQPFPRLDALTAAAQAGTLASHLQQRAHTSELLSRPTISPATFGDFPHANDCSSVRPCKEGKSSEG